MTWYRPKRGKKKAAGGLKLYKSAESGGAGWGQHWIDAVTKFTPAQQLERGLRYAKAGQVLSVSVDQGFAGAEVQGTRPRPYKVEIGLPMFTRKQWAGAVDALLKKAFYAAKLLAGDMPREIEPIFRRAGAPLIPTSKSDISTDCSCTETLSPCKHVAAVYYLLGQEIDRDPFLLMEMRGLKRAELLAEIQARRASNRALASGTPATAPAFDRPVKTVLSTRLNDFFQAPKDKPLTWPARPDDLEARLTPGGRIREMGAPPAWQSDNDFEEVMTKIYQAVRKRALG